MHARNRSQKLVETLRVVEGTKDRRGGMGKKERRAVGRAEQDRGKGRLPGIEQKLAVGKKGFPPDQSRGSIPYVCAKCGTLKKLL